MRVRERESFCFCRVRDRPFTALLLRRKYVVWRCALVYERLIEVRALWRPWGWGGDYPQA